MKTKLLHAAARLLVLLLAFAVPVWAAQSPVAPITMPQPGQFACPTCAVETSPTNHGIPVWSTTQEFGVIGPDASSAKVLCSAGLSTDPLFCSLTLGFLPSDTASNWAAKIGTPTGTGEFVRANAPTVTGNWVLPADFIDTITEIASGLKSGNGTVLVTKGSGSYVNGHMAVFDSNSNIVDGGSPSSGTKALINFESQFPIPAGDVDTFVSAGSNISATSAQAQSLAVENMTLGSPCCFVFTGTPGTLVVTLGSGTYGGTMTGSTVTVTLTTANTSVCDSSHSLAITAGQGYNIKADGNGSTTEGQLRGGCVRTL